MNRALPWLLAALGGALVLTGLVVWLTTGADPVTVYSGSYRPLEPADVEAYESVLSATSGGVGDGTRGQVLGAGLVVAGLLVVGGLAGWLVSRRSARTRAS